MSIDVNVQNDLVIVTESSEDITVNVSNAAGVPGPAGEGVPIGGATGEVLKKFSNTNYDTYWAADASGLTSVGLSMPTAFTVSNTPLTSNGTIAVSGAGTAAQYIRGDGQLATFPSTSSGGSSINYYLNGSINASVAGYKQLANTATIGGGTDFTLVGNGLIAQFLTDVGNPNRLEIPGGAWNFEMYFQVSSSGGSQKFYVELLKYNGTTFTSIASSSTVPEEITGGTSIDLYLTSIAVPTTALLVTDRLAIRVYIVDNSGGRTVTLHTEDNTLCEIITTFAGGISALNGLTANTQYLATGTSGTDFAISSATDTHTFNLPTASATNRGALSSADWSTFSGKVGGSGVTGQVAYWNGTNSQTGSNNLFWNSANNRLGINTNTPTTSLQVVGTIRGTNVSTPLVFSEGSDDLSFGTQGGTPALTIRASSRNSIFYSGILPGDGGQRLQVYGDAFIKGSGATFATTSLLIQNSASTEILKLTNDGALYLNAASLRPQTSSTNLGVYLTGSSSFLIDGTNAITGANTSSFLITRPYLPTSGSVQHNAINITSTINQTGGANGITRGLYVNPTLTAAADWRSIEWSNNSGWGLYGAGTANNYLAGNLAIGPITTWDAGIGTLSVVSGATDAPILSLKNTDATKQVYYASYNDTNKSLQYIVYGSSASGTILGQSRSNAAVVLGFNTPSVLAIGNFNNVPLVFGTSNLERARITGAGRLLLGTTTEGTFLLDVNGTARVSGASTFNNSLTNTSGGFVHSSTSSSNDAFYTLLSAAVRFYVRANGYCKSTSSIVSDTDGIGSISASAILQADSTTKGFLPPRMTSTQKGNIASPAAGLMVFDTTLAKLCVYSGTAWETITSI